MNSVLVLLIDASALGDDLSVSNILNERLLTVEEASQPDLRPTSASYGLTALHRAKTPEVAKILLDFGVQVNCRGPLGQTPLHTCCDNAAVLSVLLERGADITATTSDGSSALEWAVVDDAIDSVKLLLENGGNIQTANNNGNTPLHLVTSKRMTELLLAHGAKVSVENNEGKIPLETAAERQGEPDFAAITELLFDVSEDRGLRFREKRKILQETTSVDSFGEERNDTKSQVRRRWNLVREKFLGNREGKHGKSTLANLVVGRGRAGSVSKEWFGEEVPLTQDIDSIREASEVDSGAEIRMKEVDEEVEAVKAETPPIDDENEKGEHSDFYTRFFELAIRERPFLAKKMLDRHRTFLYAKGTAKYYLYDLNLLGGLDSVSDALRLIVEYDRRELVAHDVVQWLVTAKWGLFTQHQVWREAALYLVFIILFTLSTLKSFCPPIVAKYQGPIEFGMAILSVRYLVRLIMEWVHRGRTNDVAMSIFRADRFTGPVYIISLMILTSRYLFGMTINSYSERVMETIGSVMLWVRILYFAEAQFQSVGLTMSIVRRMIADITVYVAVQMVFLAGFAHAMTIAFRGEHPQDANYGSPATSFATLLFFIFNVDQDSVFNVQDEGTRNIAMVLLAIYEALVVVLFLNLVIAVMTTSFEDVMSNAKTEWLLVRAKICVRMEDQTSATLFTSSAKRHIRRLKAKRTAIVMERSSGENEVSLPVSLRVPHTYPLEMIYGIFSMIREYFTGRTRNGYTPIESRTSFGSAVSGVDLSSRRLKRQNSDPVVDAVTGQGEETFIVGTFVRYSVAQGHRPTTSFATSANTVPDDNPIDRSLLMKTDRSDDEIIKSLRSILLELERRKPGKVA